ncbi:MAG TPA: Gmad2 immunoglobulin-like domain-containing protein [Candidatus Eisenbacteria bacterium]|jgi:hypothetical protein|nr:Gmad2 immunoglobulin-like domain-containing protein [Candidatus Eisenbacteria bacterium]
MTSTLVRLTLLAACALAWTSCQRDRSHTSERRQVERPDTAGISSPTPPLPPSPPPKQVIVDSPASGALITSPVRVTGQARGSWYFEAEFPIRLLDSEDKMIGTGVARAKGDWMTSDFVPFEASIVFRAPPEESTGFLVIEKSNPSGSPEHAAESRVPVRFR